MAFELTPFEKTENNIQVFIASLQLVATLQHAIEDWTSTVGAHRMLNWRECEEEREVLLQVMKDRKELCKAIVGAADTLEIELGISA
jgi:hypothetical protein